MLGFGQLLQTSAADPLRPEPRNALSESHEGTPSASVSSVSELPTWSVAPAPAYGPAALQDAEKL